MESLPGSGIAVHDHMDCLTVERRDVVAETAVTVAEIPKRGCFLETVVVVI